MIGKVIAHTFAAPVSACQHFYAHPVGQVIACVGVDKIETRGTYLKKQVPGKNPGKNRTWKVCWKQKSEAMR